MSQHKHGSARRAATGCPCTLCEQMRVHRRALDRLSAKRRSIGMRAYVPAAPARAHVYRLLAEGMTRPQIAVAAGLSLGGRTIIRNLLVGQPHQKQGPAKWLRPETAAALLAVRPDAATVTAGATANATGTRRRLQALMADGWTAGEIAVRLGAATTALQIARHGRVRATTAAAVRDLYEKLADIPGPSDRSRTYWRGRGYLPPGYWDDDTIDDPQTQPEARSYDEQGELLVDLTAWRIDEAPRLFATGLPVHEIATRMSCTPRQVRRALAAARHEDDVAEASA